MPSPHHRFYPPARRLFLDRLSLAPLTQFPNRASYVCIFHSFQHSRRHRDFTVAESYDASSSNSDGLSMMTIPPSIDRSSIPEESYLAESKWWRLIKEGLIKKKKKNSFHENGKFHLFHYFSSPFTLFVCPRFSFPLERGERGKGGKIKNIFARDGTEEVVKMRLESRAFAKLTWRPPLSSSAREKWKLKD